MSVSPEIHNTSVSRPQPRRRWFQFRLLTLLLVVTGVALSLGAWRMCIEPYREQRRTADLVAKLEGRTVMSEGVNWLPYFGKDLQNLVLIDVANRDDPAEYLDAVAALPALETLVVGGPKFGDKQLRRLHRLHSLRGLVLDSTEVTDAGLAELQQALPALEVYRSPRRAIRAVATAITNAWGGGNPSSLMRTKPSLLPLPPLAAVVGPEYFEDLTECQLFHDAQILELPKYLPNITQLRLLGAGVTDAGMLQVAKLANLTSLILEYDNRVTDAGLAHLTGLNNLTGLSIHDSHDGGHGLIPTAKVTDAGLAQLARLPNLQSLGIWGTGLTDAGLAHLAEMPNLRSLRIDDFPLTDDGLAHLAHLTNLESLNFNGAEVSGAGLAHIQGLPKLATLFLANADITDVELAHLKEFKKLTQLWFYNQEIVEGGMEDLQQALPNCQLHYDSRSGPQGTWIPVAIERDGVWQAATEQEKQERRLKLKGRKFELGVGEGKVTGTSVLGEMVVDANQQKFQMTIDVTVGATPGKLAPADDHPKLLGMMEFVDEHTMKLCLDTQERPQELKSGKGRSATEYQRVHP